MECQQRVLDVFVTNADVNQEDEFDDQFICPVQNVKLITELIRGQRRVSILEILYHSPRRPLL